MKKVLSAIGIGSLMLVLLLALSFTSVSASHVQLSASETSIELESTQTKFIEVKEYYSNYPPLYLDYDKHGYTGTLTRVDVVDFGDHYQGIYEGYVQCTGVCPAEEQLDK